MTKGTRRSLCDPCRLQSCDYYDKAHRPYMKWVCFVPIKEMDEIQKQVCSGRVTQEGIRGINFKVGEKTVRKITGRDEYKR